MKKLLVPGVCALALLGLAACSDSDTDEATTQSTVEGTQPAAPTEDTMQVAPPDNNGQAEMPPPDNITTPSDLTTEPQDSGSTDRLDDPNSQPAN
ncbi:hypothetical protein B7H23_09785 [Notoacmeibacter marinus]|uniref:Secreted protein n=1 Tax=Notoacmeibacter marinus TaxID=1876515 RepID=A0A231UX06_9HYPH|nr:hypothetical protein [Notoacmeibacter marinus]OXT00412.1 hypothetical protein B7H23_09785 [Notoacmeibacter marinus]